MAHEDYERVLRAVIRAGMTRQGADVASFPGEGAVLGVTDAEANNLLPWALHTTLAHWRYRRRKPALPQPRPPHKQQRR